MPSQETVESPQPAPRILVVDAQPNEVTVLEQALAQLGATLVVARSSAITLPGDDFAALVIAGPDAPTTARRLRAQPSTRATPIVLLVDPDTADTTDTTDDPPLDLVDFLQRPLTPARVRARFTFLLERFEHLRRLAAAAQVDSAAREVSGRARAEAGRHASEQRLRLATDAAALGIWLWHLGDHRVTCESERLYEMFGLPRQDGPIDAARFVADFVHPGDARKLERAVAHTISTGQRFHFVGRFRRGDGELRWTEFTGQRIVDAAGKPVEVLGTATDVTERVRAEEALRRAAAESAAVAEANAKFRVFFDQGTYFAGVMSLDGTLVEANRLCLDATGFTRDQVVGKPFWECGWWSPSPARVAMIREASVRAAAGHTTRIETHYFVADGSERLVDLTLAPVVGDDGRVLFIAPSGHDITERKHAEEVLRSSEERFRFLDALGEATRVASDPGAILEISARLLGEHLAVARTAYADVEADSDRFTIRHDWTAPGVASTVGVYSLALFGPRAVRELHAGISLVIRDVDAELATNAGAAMFTAIGIKAIVCCPLVKGGRLAAMMAVHSATPRDWTAAEVALVEDAVERSWAHIERVRDALALREKDERLTLLIENIKDYAVIISDLDDRVTEWQGGAERITGFTAAEVLGHKTDIIFTPEDRAAGRPALETRRAATEGRAENRRWHLKKDGTRFFGDGVTIALYDEHGALRGFGKVFKDATGEELAKQSRRNHSDQLRRLADISSRLNAMLDLDSVLRVVTEEGRILIGAHQAITNIATDVDRPARAASFSDPLPLSELAALPPDRSDIYRVLTAGNVPVRLTHDQLRAHDGWSRIRGAAELPPTMRGLLAAPIVGRNGELLGVVSLSDKFTEDFTEEDEALLVQLAQMAAVAVENTALYQALRDADRRKDEFLAMLAHELRNPLAPMQNALAILEHQGSREPTPVRLRAVMGRQIGQLTRLVDDLLDVARITSGKVALQRERVELARVVQLAVETSLPLLESKRHTLTLTVAETPVWLDADLVRLSQVIANLLNNAAKYTDEGGKIDLVAGAEGALAVVRVRDNGIGLPPEMLPRVFDLFTQASTGLARSAGGLGIGLTLVRKLVELHDGSVGVTSRGLGTGSEFVVRLPIAARVAASDPDSGGEGPAAARRVLVVDDNPDVLETMEMLLEMQGHVVTTACDGIQAVEVARSFRPDVMLLDLGLPGRDGYEVARVLRKEFPRGTLWLIALSGYGQAEDRQRTQEAGFDRHLVKPVDPDVLAAALGARPS